MKEVYLVLAEQLRNFRIIFRLSRYEEKATYQSHYLGLLWQILNPLIQIAIYYLIFGLGMNGGREVNGDPFIVWMLCGIIPWFFISSSILGGSNSIYTQVNLVSKMKFPVSILPSINFVSNLSSYFPMLGFYLIIMIGIFDISPSLYWIQYIYYFFA
ncbi:ABC transporter permease, partial [Enterococcus asini]|uniref:ABC transporter permease n=1 Tax=Enterococcus asini TaxID=57732 RepID=UPI00266DD683